MILRVATLAASFAVLSSRRSFTSKRAWSSFVRPVRGTWSSLTIRNGVLIVAILAPGRLRR